MTTEFAPLRLQNHLNSIKFNNVNQGKMKLKKLNKFLTLSHYTVMKFKKKNKMGLSEREKQI